MRLRGFTPADRSSTTRRSPSAGLPVRSLSQGQRRRVALARLARSGAKLWALDEPFAALDAGAVVVPVCIRYTGGGPPGEEGDTALPAFVGADTLWTSLRRVLAAPGLTVSLAVSPALYPDTAATRRALAVYA